MKQVLIVEDNPKAAQDLANHFSSRGFEVQLAATLAQAKQCVLNMHASGEKFDLIVSDFDLGSTIKTKYRFLDGYRFVRWCKQQSVQSEIILHSRGFSKERRFSRFFRRPIMAWARRLGIIVQGKSELLGEKRKKRGAQNRKP